MAVPLPGRSLAETYLSADALVPRPAAPAADALHPGYGFLSENPALAEACGAAGIVWVGPTPGAMRIMGHKARAKETVAAAGVPVLPGAAVTAGMPDGRPAGSRLVGRLPAAGQGLGRRWRPGHAAGRRDRRTGRRAWRRHSVRRLSAFGSDDVFLERYLPRPGTSRCRYIGDEHGTVLHLFDRECSVQRRHQKVIEEAPAVLVDRRPRGPGCGRRRPQRRPSVGYHGVGTVEFLVDGDEFYFLEMNTRLQVEHGVTELVTGLDLVGLQFSVAAGAPAAPRARRTSPYRATPWRHASAPSGHARTTGPPRARVTHVCWPSGRRAADRRRHRIGQRWSAPRTTPWWRSSWRTPRTACWRAARLAAGPARPGARRPRDQPATARRRPGRRVIRRRGTSGSTTSIPGPICATPTSVTRSGTATPPRRPSPSSRTRARRSLVPVPAAGWRNVGTALHVDALARRRGHPRGARCPHLDRPACVRCDGQWVEVGRATVRDGVVDLTSRRPAPALSRAALAPTPPR